MRGTRRSISKKVSVASVMKRSSGSSLSVCLA